MGRCPPTGWRAPSTGRRAGMVRGERGAQVALDEVARALGRQRHRVPPHREARDQREGRLVLHGEPAHPHAARSVLAEEAAEVRRPRAVVVAARLAAQRAPHQAAAVLHPRGRRPRRADQLEPRLERQRRAEQRQLARLVHRHREVAQREVAGRVVVVRVRRGGEVRAADGHAAEPVPEAVGPKVLTEQLRLQRPRNAR